MLTYITVIMCILIFPNKAIDFPEQFICTADYCYCCFLTNKNKSDFHLSPIISTRFITSKKDSNYFNYQLYYKTNIRKILTRDIITYYSCNSYSQYYGFSYYPVIFEMTLSEKIKLPKNLTGDKSLYECLKNYSLLCVNKQLNIYTINRLECFDNTIRTLKIGFKKSGTVRELNMICMQNITYAHIRSFNLISIKKSPLFYIISNLVFLRLETSTFLINFSCDNFGPLQQLRSLQIHTGNSLDIKSCLFKFNPNLVEVQLRKFRIWNMCNGLIELWNNSGLQKVYYDSEINISSNLSEDMYSIIFKNIYIAIFILWIIGLMLIIFLNFFKRPPATSTNCIFNEYLV